MHPMLNIAISAARYSSKILLRFMDHLDTINVSEKSRNDLVTEVDKLSEQEIIKTIRKAYPNHAILAEESGEMEGNEFTWIIDPLDGTMNYVHGFPQFAISIALRHKNNIETGVIYDPLRNELFTAVRGEGAHLNNRRIRTSSVDKLNRSLIGTGFPVRDESQVQSYIQTFAKVFPQCSGVRRAGAAVLDLAYVAAGRLDGFWENGLQIWDLAAGALLVQEAGGIVSDYRGEKNYLEKGEIVAANPKIFRLLLKEIQT